MISMCRIAESKANAFCTLLVPEGRFLPTAYAMIGLASICIIARVGIQTSRRKPLESQDYIIYVAFVFFLAMSTCYIHVIPHMDKIFKVGMGVVAPWPEIEDDKIAYSRILFAIPILFWVALWLAKLSLLALCKKLMEGLPKTYNRVRRAVLIFCLIVSPAPYDDDDDDDGSLLICATVSGGLLGIIHDLLPPVHR